MPIASGSMAPSCGCRSHEQALDSAGPRGARWPSFSPTKSAGEDKFDGDWQRLKRGPTYGLPKTGVFQICYPFSAGVEYENWIDVPADYDPAKKLAAPRAAARRRVTAVAECGAARPPEANHAGA